MGRPNQAADAVTSGLFFVLVQGGTFQFGKKFSKPPAEDIHYAETRHMLHNLGLQTYEKNFKHFASTHRQCSQRCINPSWTKDFDSDHIESHSFSRDEEKMMEPYSFKVVDAFPGQLYISRTSCTTLPDLKLDEFPLHWPPKLMKDYVGSPNSSPVMRGLSLV
ncbi:hypothetical protein K1719_028379 [Acacia pycnantha]|nr:hypothetical protein K1719_028379 [Acacia pycnantha]